VSLYLPYLQVITLNKPPR